MDQLVSFQFGTFHEGFAALRTYVYPWPVRVEMFSHCRIITEHLGTAFMWTRDGARDIITRLAFGLYSAFIMKNEEEKNVLTIGLLKKYVVLHENRCWKINMHA